MEDNKIEIFIDKLAIEIFTHYFAQRVSLGRFNGPNNWFHFPEILSKHSPAPSLSPNEVSVSAAATNDVAEAEGCQISQEGHTRVQSPVEQFHFRRANCTAATERNSLQ